MDNVVPFEKFLAYRLKSLRMIREVACLNCNHGNFIVPFAMNVDFITCPRCKSTNVTYSDEPQMNQLPRS